MKTLLIQPPVRVDHDPIDIPAGLGILCSIAMKKNHEVALLDLNSTRPVPTWHDAAEQIAVEKWDLIGIGGLSSMYKDIKKTSSVNQKIESKRTHCLWWWIHYLHAR